MNILNSLPLSPAELLEIGKYWCYSQASFNQDVFFLREEFLKEAVATCSINPEAAQELYSQAATIRASEALSRLAWHYHWMYNLAPDAIRSLRPECPGNLGLTYFNSIAVVISGLPQIRAFYISRGIPEKIFRDSMTGIEIWSQTNMELRKVWGTPNLWPYEATKPTLFRLGRIEFQFNKPYEDFLQYKFFRRKSDGQLLIMAPANLSVTQDGLVCNGKDTPAWTTYYSENPGGTITGNAVSPKGYLQPTPITISLSEWDIPLHREDAVLELHIPAGCPLRFEDCQASLSQAMDFFPRYFPEFHFKAIIGESWLFDPDLYKILPQHSNIIKFQSLIHLFPKISHNTDWQIRERVFGNPDLELDQVPRTSSLQKALYNAISGGTIFHNGNSIIMR